MRKQALLQVEDFEQCMKCAICTVYCPVLRVNPSFPGPKQAGPDAERFRLKDPSYFDESLRYCLNCKQCEVACPSGVRVGDLIQLACYRYGRGHLSLRNFFLANTDLVGCLATAVAPLANYVLGLPLAKMAMDCVLHVASERTFPCYSSQTFEHWFRREARAYQDAFSKKVAFFHGCYVNYNYPLLGRQVVGILNALNVGVELLEDECCCGVPQISNGFFSRARSQATRNLGAIRKALSGGCAGVVTASSTCCLTIRDEYRHVLDMDSEDIREDVDLITRMIFKMIDSGEARLAFREDFRRKVAYHRPCHLRRLGWEIYTVRLLEMVPGLELSLLAPSCCGLSGTYGFKKENYEVSQAVGAPLFREIESQDADVICCECETCKWQIEMSTSRKVVHPVSLLYEALDLEATARLNGR